MTQDRLKSIVPMFGGGTRYVETLDDILEFVADSRPTSDELVEWHRGHFPNVSSRDSIMRRIRYLTNVGFLTQHGGEWHLGEYGEEYVRTLDRETLLRIMCERNVGLRSLLYALSAGAMTIDAISDQQLATHPQLGWTQGETDMALQRVNWLRSMGLVEKTGAEYTLTERGIAFVESAVEDWADAARTHEGGLTEVTATDYETWTTARAVDPEFRATVLSQHGGTCPVSGVDHAGLLDVAHVLSWSDFPDHRSDLANVLPLSKLHHAAFDRGLFTLDRDFRVLLHPEFSTDSDLLHRSLIERAGERVSLGVDQVDPAYLGRHNEALNWI